jgi:uncharacterized protein (DUF305 family)
MMRVEVASTKCGAAASGLRFVAVLVVAAAAASVSAEEKTGTTPAVVAGESAAQLYNQGDLLFLTHMIVHHEQALDMTALVPSRTNRDALIRFARYLDGAQRAEIDQMSSWLRLAKERGIEIPEHHLHGDPPMAGMLSKAQMSALAAAKGAEFERLWLEGMILHHQGALDMGRAQQEQQFANGRRPYGIDVMVDEILVVQRAEITKMRAWLAEWGLSKRP